MTLTDAQRAELVAITKRDAITNEMWLLGPPASFTAQAARDRRFLLEIVHTLRLELQAYPLLPDTEDTSLCACGAFALDGTVVHAPSCKARTACTQ